MASIVIFRLNISLSPMPVPTTISRVLSIVPSMTPISKTLMNGMRVVHQQTMSGMTSVLFMRVFLGKLFLQLLSFSTQFVPQNKITPSWSWTISAYCISSSLWHWYVIDLSFVNDSPFCILRYKFLSYGLHVISELSELSKLSGALGALRGFHL